MSRESNLKYRYGVTLSDYDHLARIHDYKCWICRESPATDVDHDPPFPVVILSVVFSVVPVTSLWDITRRGRWKRIPSG